MVLPRDTCWLCMPAGVTPAMPRKAMDGSCPASSAPRGRVLTRCGRDPRWAGPSAVLASARWTRRRSWSRCCPHKVMACRRIPSACRVLSGGSASREGTARVPCSHPVGERWPASPKRDCRGSGRHRRLPTVGSSWTSADQGISWPGRTYGVEFSSRNGIVSPTAMGRRLTEPVPSRWPTERCVRRLSEEWRFRAESAR